MKRFANLLKKKERNVIGILSGTSIDAVDIALVKIRGTGKDLKIRVKDFKSFAIPLNLKNYILHCSSKKTGNVEDVCKANFVVGRLFARSINKFVRTNKLRNSDIDLIGSHGQTIYHYPRKKKIYGFDSGSTLQIGDPSVISNLTGILTVGDFRNADIAAGGSGAPLVPYLDYSIYGKSNRNRVLVNIGGITNATYLKKNSGREDVIAFDTGPGNMIIDMIAKKYFGKRFDFNGSTAFKGKINDKLFEHICRSDKFYKKKFPKSTGREQYGQDFFEVVMKNFKGVKPQDALATFTKFTAFALYYNLKKFPLDEMIISGGGSRNLFLLKWIREYFRNVTIRIADQNGITAENKEAVLFALLANELLNGAKTNIKSVTGADRNVYLGKICLA